MMQWRKPFATILVALLLTGLVGTGAFGQGITATPQYQAAVKLLTEFGIVRGDAAGNLNPQNPITRAEIAKVLVAAAGMEAQAQALATAVPFPDVQGHWSAGYVALARNAGWISGYPDGSFGPQRNVSLAEVVTLLVRFVGLDASAKQTPGAWPDNYITVGEQTQIIDSSVDVRGLKNQSALRAQVFVLSNNAFTNVAVDSQGHTTYRKHFDNEPPVLQVDALPATSTETMIAVKGTVTGAAVVEVNGRTLTTTGSGVFVTVVALQEGPNEITVTARDAVGNTAAQRFTVERPAAPTVRILAPATLAVGAGNTVTVPVSVVDANGQPVAGATAGGQVEGGVGTYNAAAGTFTAASQPGTGKLVLTYQDARSEVAVTVAARTVARVVVNPAAVTMRPGVAQSFTAKALDADGSEIPGAAVTWSTEAGKGVIDSSGNFTPTGTGTIKVTATVGDVSGEATVTVAGNATKLAFGPLEELVANGKSQVSVTVMAQDADGNTDGNFSGNITLVVNSATYAGFPGSSGAIDPGVLGKTVAASGGVATFTLVANTLPGDTTLSVASTGLTGSLATLKTQAQTISDISITATPAQLAADNVSTSSVKVKLLDQTGQPFVGTSAAGWTATFTSSDTNVVTVPGTTLNATADPANGANMTVTATAKVQVGTANVTAAVKFNSQERFVKSAEISTILVGEPVKVVGSPSTASATARQSGGSEYMTVSFQLQDPNGNVVTKLNSFAGLTLSLTADDNAYTAVYSPTSATNRVSGTIPAGGLALSGTNATISSGTVSVRVASGKAQTVKFTLGGSYAGTTLGAGTVTGTFSPGAAKTITLTAVKGTIPSGTGTDTLRAEIRDNADLSTATTVLTDRNVVTSGSHAVTLKRTAGSTTQWTADVSVNSQNGVAEATVKAGAGVGTDAFTASFNPGTVTTSTVANVTVAIIGPAHHLAFTSYPQAASPAAAGVSHTVKVAVKDAQSPAVTVSGDSSTLVSLTIKDSAGTQVASYNATATYGTATFNVTVAQSGTFTATATSASLAAASVTDYTVAASVATQLVGELSSPTLAAASDSNITLTIWAADAAGNKLTAALSNVNVSSDSTSVVTVSGACSGNASSCTFTLTGTSNTGTAILTASKSGLSSFTTPVSAVVTGEARDTEVLVDQGGSVGSLSSSSTAVRQRVRVRLKDANGNIVTQNSNQRWVKLEAGGEGYTSGNLSAYESAGMTVVSGQTKNWVQTNQGVATFFVNTTRAGTITYTAYIVTGQGSDTQAASTTSASNSGTFQAGTANKVVVPAASPASIPGDGSSITSITAKVTDQWDNLTAVSGTFTFTLSSNTHAFLLNADANGIVKVDTTTGSAQAVLQARYATANGTLTVSASFAPTETNLSLPGGTSATSPSITVTAP